MECESSLFLMALPVDVDDLKDDVDLLSRNWDCLSQTLKEHNLVLDLLNILSGLPSSFFICSKNRLTGKYDVVTNPLIKRDFDDDVLEMCCKILEIRMHQMIIIDFANENTKSYICQTLTGEFANVLEDLQHSVCKFHELEIECALGVQKLHNYLKPARQTLSFLSSVVTDVNTEKLLDDKSNFGVLILDHMEERTKTELGLKRELVQHLVNICLESYLTLIDSYLRYFSVNDCVLDFFIKKNPKITSEDDFWRVDGSADIHKGNASRLIHTSEIVCAGCREMNLRIDERYLPKMFKNIASKVLETGVCLRLMDKQLEEQLVYKSVEELVFDLDRIHNKVSKQFFEYLKNVSKIFDVMKDFFDMYLFQKSEYVETILTTLESNVQFRGIHNQINTQITWNMKTSGIFKSLKRSWDEFDAFDIRHLNEDGSIRVEIPRFYLNYDNLTNLSIGLESFKQHRYLRDDEFRGCDWSKMSNGLKNSDEKESNSRNDDESIDSDVLKHLEVDYRNLVLCCELDNASKVVFTDEIVYKYQLIFKLIFQLKYVEYKLDHLSVYHIKSSQIPIEPELAPQYNLQIFTVSKMQQFVRTLLQHFLVDVVSTKLSEFSLARHSDLESLCSGYRELVEYIIDSLMFREYQLIEVLQKIVLLCHKFATEILNFVNNPIFAPDSHDYELVDDGYTSFFRFQANLESRSYTLNSLLNNPGYRNVVSIANAEFDKNFKVFKSYLSKSNHALKEKFV